MVRLTEGFIANLTKYASYTKHNYTADDAIVAIQEPLRKIKNIPGYPEGMIKCYIRDNSSVAGAYFLDLFFIPSLNLFS